MARFTEVARDVFQWTDTCNVYLVRDADAAVLVDLGDGSVLDALPSLGVRTLDRVLFTHHHREQCQGAARLEPWRQRGTRVCVPAAERPLFEQPLTFRRLRPTLNDPHTVHGASYVRPPVAAVPADVAFARMDDFTWRGREFWCVATPGDSPGHMAYLLRDGEEWLAFSGDLVTGDARMHLWFDVEWDYGFAKGLYELGNSVGQVAGYRPRLLLPSHGPAIPDPKPVLETYLARLRHLAPLYIRGYELFRFAGADQDTASRPSKVPHLWQLSPHLFKFRGPDYWPNFALVLAESGRGLVVDCGLFDRAFLDRALERARDRLGLKGIDAVFVTHMHGDHALEAGHLRERWGAQLWTLEGVADKFERPWDHDLAALLPYYGEPGKGPAPLKFDRVLADGETVRWEGYSFTADWMPGQTKYHACLHGEIDGRLVAFTGDNLFANPADPAQGGNEAVVARNGGALEEGYLYAAEYLHGLSPDLLVGGHCWVMDRPQELIGRFRRRARDLRAAFQALSVEEDYRYMFDPYWVRALPYRQVIAPGTTARFAVQVRNYQPRAQVVDVTLALPPGLTARPARFESRLPGEGTGIQEIDLSVDPSARPGLNLLAFDVTRDGRRLGQVFDAIVWVGTEPVAG